MGIPSEIWKTIKSIANFEKELEVILKSQIRIEGQVDKFSSKLDTKNQRLTKLETLYEALKENVSLEVY